MLIKLNSGEEIIVSEIKKCEDIDNVVIVVEPYYIMKILKSERLSFQLDKWMPYADNSEFPIDVSNIITYNKPDSDLYNFYIQTIQDDREALHYHDYTGQIH